MTKLNKMSVIPVDNKKQPIFISNRILTLIKINPRTNKDVWIYCLKAKFIRFVKFIVRFMTPFIGIV